MIPTVDAWMQPQRSVIPTTTVSAWYGPRGVLISNDELAEFVAETGGRLRGDLSCRVD
ncbi:hypothetical protein ACFYNY_20545 [Streptomyces sp. NPDC006530]|uniref:hypothetical protein n=1 Tax=Streptomyces sp. NPDC006530 TaxID=3364750 RepID=UPI00367B5BCD